MRQRHERDWLGLSVSTAAGLGLGVLAGIIVGELLGDVHSERVRGAVRRLRGTPRARSGAGERTLERAVRDALDENPSTRELRVSVHALGDGIVELTGTVPDADARPLANRVAQGVTGVHIVVNRLLIEDDGGRRVVSPNAG